MDLIFLHGPPASGKFTIAKELGEKLGYGIFHNHLTIDVVRPFFEFDSPNFWKLVKELRLFSLRIAAGNCANSVIYTSCYDHPNDLEFVEEIENIVCQHGGRFIPIYLQCEIDELERRISNSSRVEMNKITSINGLQKKLKKWNCIAVPKTNCATILTAGKTVTECTEEIINVIKQCR